MEVYMSDFPVWSGFGFAPSQVLMLPLRKPLHAARRWTEKGKPDTKTFWSLYNEAWPVCEQTEACNMPAVCAAIVGDDEAILYSCAGHAGDEAMQDDETWLEIEEVQFSDDEEDKAS